MWGRETRVYWYYMFFKMLWSINIRDYYKECHEFILIRKPPWHPNDPPSMPSSWHSLFLNNWNGTPKIKIFAEFAFKRQTIKIIVEYAKLCDWSKKLLIWKVSGFPPKMFQELSKYLLVAIDISLPNNKFFKNCKHIYNQTISHQNFCSTNHKKL